MPREQGRLAAVLVFVAGLLLAGGFLLQGPWSAVAWRNEHAVAIESDDWGLAGFLPDAHALDGLDREKLAPGTFPPVYWKSTLEDSAAVVELAEILARYRGRDGLPAVMQPNYVMGSMDLSLSGGEPTWSYRTWPEFPAGYRRPGLVPAVRRAVADGVWYPEYHALYHYDPEVRIAAVGRGGIAELAAKRDIMIFPGSQSAWELGPGRPLPLLADELDIGLSAFAAAFGRRPGAIIAPDYTWDSRMEDLWLSRGLDVIQAKREQRFAGRKWGTVSRIRKLVQQRWEYLVHRDRVYLERNCRFEPAQDAHPDEVAGRCLAEVRAAWARGEVAVIEAHRINFVHTDSTVAGQGRSALAALLRGLEQVPGAEPVFLTDHEIASLMRSGTSVCRRGDRIVVRNWTHSARLVPLSGMVPEGDFCWLEAGSTRIVPAEES